MNRNEMPCAQGAGHIIILDDESISRNVSAIKAILTKSNLIIGKSSPLITNYDIAEQDLFIDSQFCNSMITADKHLRSNGFIPCWNRGDLVRLHRYLGMLTSWSEYAGTK